MTRADQSLPGVWNAVIWRVAVGVVRCAESHWPVRETLEPWWLRRRFAANPEPEFMTCDFVVRESRKLCTEPRP
jgi:hypothetical protein